MSRLYTQRRHEQALGELKAEYDGRLKELQAALAELKEENRSLSAEISLLSAQKQSISDAMIAAGEKREEMQAQLAVFIESETSKKAGEEWELKEVLETLGLCDD